MRNLQNIVIEIISELLRIQQLPQPYRDPDDTFPLPRELSVGGGQVISISKKIDLLISDTARKMRSDGPLQGQFTAGDYNYLVRRAFGPALQKIEPNLTLTENARSVLADVETKVAKDVAWTLNNGRQEYACGCTLFIQKDIAPLELGPVRFEPREIWLERKASDGRSARIVKGGKIERFDHQIADGPISKVAKRRILRVWQGQKPKTRKRSYDSILETGIIEAIGDCPYVCSVKIPGLGGKAGQDKAILAARLALASLSLMWQNSTSALSGMNLLLDRKMRGQSVISFASDGLTSPNRWKSDMPHAPFVERKTLEELLKDFSSEFSIAGEAIAWLIEPSASHNRPKLLSVFAQAMMWFHDGCRETTDLKAIVSFASCLDILASGDGRTTIPKLIRARLGIQRDAKIHRDGLTVEEVINQIYDDARTRFIHGPIQRKKHVWGGKLGYDWSETRDLAAQLARMCLLCCMGWAAQNPACDDPGQLLN